MRLFRNKYYLIPAKNIDKALWVEKDYGKEFQGRIPITVFFLENEISQEFQKIVLVVPFKKNLLNRMTDKANAKLNSFFAQELISGFSFCRIPQDKSDDNRICLTNLPFDGYNELIRIISDIKPCSLDDVKDFFNGLKSKRMVDGYFGVLRQMFAENEIAMKNLESKRGDLSLGSVEKFLKR